MGCEKEGKKRAFHSAPARRLVDKATQQDRGLDIEIGEVILEVVFIEMGSRDDHQRESVVVSQTCGGRIGSGRTNVSITRRRKESIDTNVGSQLAVFEEIRGLGKYLLDPRSTSVGTIVQEFNQPSSNLTAGGKIPEIVSAITNTVFPKH